MSIYTQRCNNMICRFIADIKTDLQSLIALLGLPEIVFNEADILLESYLESEDRNFLKCDDSVDCMNYCNPELLHTTRGVLTSPNRGFLEAIVYIAAQVSEHPRILNDILEKSMNEVRQIDNI